ncbi:hypothetical protein HMPREF1486_05173 [Streptomyces sp. HPH0547]|nr:hypothetical protein HMPREF1486_05173 [Streptomyces sp. HPH0547]
MTARRGERHPTTTAPGCPGHDGQDGRAIQWYSAIATLVARL